MATTNTGAGGAAGGAGGNEGKGGTVGSAGKAIGTGGAGGKTAGTGAGTTGAGGAGRAGSKSAGAGGTRKGSASKTKATSGAKSGRSGTAGKKKTAATKAGTTGGGARGAKKGTTGKKTSSRSKTAGGKASASPELRNDLREFVQAHPGGWGHNEWIGLVNLLRDRGHDTSDTDAIGMALERERLTLVLERVPGLGGNRVKAIADKYPRIWNVMQAGADELAAVANLPKAVAKKVKDALS